MIAWVFEGFIASCKIIGVPLYILGWVQFFIVVGSGIAAYAH